MIIAILSTFDFTYLARACYSFYFVVAVIENQEKCEDTFKESIFDIFVGAIFDLIPISLILLIHTINFKTVIRNESDTIGETID